MEIPIPPEMAQLWGFRQTMKEGCERSELVRVDIELDETAIKRCSADPQSLGGLSSVAFCLR